MLKRVNGRALALAVILVLPTASVARADFEQAMNYFKSGKYVEAAAEFQTLVDNSPNYDSGYYMLGQSLLQMRKPVEAEKNFHKAIELNGEKFEYHYGLARAFFDQKKHSDAVGTLKTAEPLATEAQTQYALYSLRGYAYSALEAWGDAVEDLEKARAIKKDPSVLTQLGKAYYGLGHNDKAAPVFREALKARPKDSTATQLLAESLINLGAGAGDDARKGALYKEALQTAEQYAQMNPNSYEAHNLVGRAALGAQQFDKAEQSFRRVLAQKPDYCYAMINLGKTYVARERWTDAEGILKDAAECAPRMALVYENLGFVVEKQQRLEEAIAQYEKAMQIKPSAGLRAAVERCEANIEVREHNEAMEEAERRQQEEALRAQQEYDEAKAKEEEWKKRTRDE